MKKLISLILLCLGWGMTTTYAQEDVAALDKAVEQFKQAKDVSASFSLTLYNAMNEPTDRQTGSIKLSGNKFYWHTDEMVVWYDGTSQWTYVKSIEEVNLLEPTTDEIATINPYILITNYKKSYTAKAIPSQNSQEAVIELTPKEKGTNIDHIVITLNRTSWIPSSFKVYTGDRSHSIITLSDYTPGQNFPTNTFVFDEEQYPQAELIDLR